MSQDKPLNFPQRWALMVVAIVGFIALMLAGVGVVGGVAWLLTEWLGVNWGIGIFFLLLFSFALTIGD